MPSRPYGELCETQHLALFWNVGSRKSARPNLQRWPRDRENLVHDGIVGVAAARDRRHRRGIETAVFDETVVDVDADDLPEHDVAMRRLAVEIDHLDDLQQLALE